MNVSGISGYGFYQYSRMFQKPIEFASEKEAKEINEEFNEILKKEEEKLLNGSRKELRE